jgi:hypothetical protein
MKTSRLYGATITAILIIFTFGIANAIVPLPKEHARVYISAILPYNTIGGDFDGTKGLTVPQTGETFMVPDIESGIGFGGAIGYTRIGGRNLGYGMELSYQRSSHDYTYIGYRGKCTLNALSFDLKGILSYTPIEPYLVFGIVFPWLNVNDGAIMTGTVNADAKYSGIGINLGAGIDLFLIPNLSFGGRLGYRYISYTQVIGHGDRIKIDGGANGSGVSISGNISFHIPII